MKFVPFSKSGTSTAKSYRQTRFDGLDLMSGEYNTSPSRTPYCMNVYSPNGKGLKMRPAKKLLRKYGGEIRGIHTYLRGNTTHILVHAGDKIYLDGDTPRILARYVGGKFSTSVEYKGKLFIVDGCRVRVYDGVRLRDLEEFVAPPEYSAKTYNLTTVNAIYHFNADGKGKLNFPDLAYGEVEGKNCEMIDGELWYTPTWADETLVAHLTFHGKNYVEETLEGALSNSKTALAHIPMPQSCQVFLETYTEEWEDYSETEYLPISLIEERDSYFGESFEYASHFSVEENYLCYDGGLESVYVDRGDGSDYTRHFTGNVIITYDAIDLPKTVLDSATTLSVYEGALHLGGTEDFAITDTACTDCVIKSVGKATAKIVGYIPLPDGRQAIFKEKSGNFPSLYFRGPDGKIVPSSANEYGIAERGFTVFGDERLFLSGDGVYSLKVGEYDFNNKCFAARRSYYITPKLEAADGRSILLEHNGALFISAGGELFCSKNAERHSVDGESSLDFFVWDIAATALISYGKQLLIGCADGGLYTLFAGSAYDESVSGQPRPIYASWRTPFLDFGIMDREKRLLGVFATQAPLVGGGIKITHITKSANGRSVSAPKRFSLGNFCLDALDFTNIIFEEDTLPRTAALIEPCPFSLISLSFDSVEGTFFSLLGFEARYRVGRSERG